MSLSYTRIAVVKADSEAENALHGGCACCRVSRVYIQHRGLDSHQVHYEKRKNGQGYLFTRSQFKFIGDGAGES